MKSSLLDQITRISYFLIISLLFIRCQTHTDSGTKSYSQTEERNTTGNPILPGYFADADIIEFEGKYYIYTTIDPWGGYEIAVWESDDFQTWFMQRINWPTKDQCTSPTSNNGLVLAPSVVRGRNGKFYMYVTAGSEIWVGISDHPLGPWYNLLTDNRPLIPYLPGSVIHNFGAECFIDDDGQAYLYWGSGWNWENGRCYAAKLSDDMCSFVDGPIDITPPHYFEAPSMLKKSGRYYLLYSEGRCYDSTYKIRYAISDHPLGVWKEGKNSPILQSEPERGVNGPGHPTSFQYNNQYYILYNRIELPEFYFLSRQLCIDSLNFDDDEYIQHIDPSSEGVTYFLPLSSGTFNLAATRPVSATSELSAKFSANAVTDMKFGTKWVAADSTDEASITIDLGQKKKFMNIYTWFEYPYEAYSYFIEYSNDSQKWKIFAIKLDDEERGSPRVDSKSVKGRYIRITLHHDYRAIRRPAIWEIMVE